MRVCPTDRLSVGIQLPVQALSSRFADEWEHDASVGDMISIAEAADRAGLFYVAVCDHVAVPRVDAEAMGTTWFDTIATLGLLAGRTHRVRLLSHVYIPAYRHPLQVAKAFATLDRLSAGRVILGVGAGHVLGEFEVLGADHRRRGALLDESIAAISAALVDEFPDVDGDTWSFAHAGVGPRPVQQPRPPVWIGGSSPAAIRRVGRLGDGWLPQGTPLADIPAALEIIVAEAETAGRGDEPLDIGANGPLVHVGDPPGHIEGDRRFITGDPERVAAALGRWTDAGVDHVQVAFRGARSAQEWCDQIERFGDEVLPLLGKEDR
ncbi:MAG TPA: TIGR03619 family F420-dependent LLM class oxidoreductase [Acidimicrobiales bacterium]